MDIIKRLEIISVCKDVEKREPCTSLVVCKLVQPLWKTVWRLKIELPYDLEIPLLGKNTNLKRYLYPHVHCSIIYNNQDVGTT